MSRVVKSYNVNFTQDVVHLKGSSYVEVDEKDNQIDEEQTSKHIQENINNLMESANKEAESIINNALAEAAKIKDQAYREIEVQKVKIYEQSKIEGYNEGQKLSKIELENKLAEIEEVKQQAINEKQKTLNEIEPHMVEIIKQLTSKLIGNYVKYNDQFILYLVKSGLGDIKESKTIKVRVSQSHRATIEENYNIFSQGISKDTNIEFIYTEEFDVTDCIIETPYGNIDLSLDVQLKKLREYLDLLFSE